MVVGEKRSAAGTTMRGAVDTVTAGYIASTVTLGNVPLSVMIPSATSSVQGSIRVLVEVPSPLLVKLVLIVAGLPVPLRYQMAVVGAPCAVAVMVRVSPTLIV